MNLQKLCLQALSRCLFHFHSLERKKPICKAKLKRKRIHQKHVGARENMTPGYLTILCEKDVNNYCSRIGKKGYCKEKVENK